MRPPLRLTKPMTSSVMFCSSRMMSARSELWLRCCRTVTIKVWSLPKPHRRGSPCCGYGLGWSMAGRVVVRVLTRPYAVTLARNGREALDVLEAQGDSIDLILTDLLMPEVRADQSGIQEQTFVLTQQPAPQPCIVRWGI